MLCIPPVRAALTISIHSRSSLFCSVQGRKQNNFQKTDTGSRLLMWWRNYSSVCLLLPANWTISLPVAAAFCLLASLKSTDFKRKRVFLFCLRSYRCHYLIIFAYLPKTIAHWAIATRTLALASCEPSGVLEKRKQRQSTFTASSALEMRGEREKEREKAHCAWLIWLALKRITSTAGDKRSTSVLLFQRRVTGISKNECLSTHTACAGAWAPKRLAL